MSLVKRIVDQFMRIYLWPLRSSKRIYFYTLDIFFSPINLHIHRAINYIKKSGEHENCLIVDVGCHHSGFINDFLKRFKKCRVIAFEPNIEKFEMAQNKYKNSNVEVNNLALGRELSTATLNITKHDYSSSILDIDAHTETFEVVKKQTCTISTLDDQLEHETEVLLLKLDTQGYELEILIGGEKTLPKTQYILLEMANHWIYKNSPKYYDVDQFLRGHGFSLVQIYSPLGDANEFDTLYRNNKIA